jgi:hypothetical protein
MSPALSWLVILGAGVLAIAASAVLSLCVGLTLKAFDRAVERDRSQPRMYVGTVRLE